MKRLLFIAIVLVLGGWQCKAQETKMAEVLEENLLPNGKLNGDIKQIQMETYRYNYRFSKSDTLTHNGFFYSIFFFNKDNECVRIKNYGDNHKLDSYTRLSYNKNGLLVKTRERGDGIFKLDHDYTYGINNRIEKEVFLRAFKHKHIYNDKGQLAKIVVHFKRKIWEVYTYKYDNNGNKIEECQFDENNALESKTIYTYNSNGKVVEKCEFDAKGKSGDRVEYRYNDDNTLIEKIYCHSYGSKYVAKYDSKGREIESRGFDSDGRLNSITTYSYDSHQNVYKVESTKFYKDGEESLELDLFSIEYR